VSRHPFPGIGVSSAEISVTTRFYSIDPHNRFPFRVNSASVADRGWRDRKGIASGATMSPTNVMHTESPTAQEPTLMEPFSVPRRILVIDHDDDIRRILCDRLNALGFEVAGERTSISGLSRIAHDQETAPFHGVLVELHMPVLGGLAVLQEMRERFPAVPVIVMSDSMHITKLREAMNAGAKEYIVKPFDSELFRLKCMSVFLNGEEYRV
jgi:CheY-like chemotaxis protein